MQTPTKFALALLAVVAAVAPMTMTANAGHSISMNGQFLAGTDCAQTQSGIGITCPVDVTGDATDACLDPTGTFQGLTSTCTHIFPDETSQIVIDVINNTTTVIPAYYTLVANGVHIEPLSLGITGGLFGACAGVKAAQSGAAFVLGAPATSTPPTQQDVGNATNYTAAWAKYQTTPSDHTNLLYNASACKLDGAFTKQASVLKLKACFYDAIGALIQCQSKYDYKGDLSGIVPVGAAKLSVRSSVNTLNVAWWWYPGVI